MAEAAPTITSTATPDDVPESFRVRINGFKRQLGVPQTKKFLKRMSVNFTKVKRIVGQSYCYVTHSTEADMNNAITVLNGYQLGKRTLQVERAEPAPMKTDSDRTMPLPDDIRDVVTPFYKLPYPEQLQKKREFVEKVLKKYKANVDEVVPSPVLEAYRNKVSFTVGHDVDRVPCVGFLLGRLKEGFTATADPSKTLVVSAAALRARNAFQEVVVNSALVPWSKRDTKGFWRELNVRDSLDGSFVATVQVCEQGVEQAALQGAKSATVSALKNLEGCTGVQWQRNCDISGASRNTVSEMLSGSPLITEKLGDLTFVRGPESFFQTNTLGTVQLYNRIKRLAAGEIERLGQDTDIFDVCCGIGTISLYVASVAKRVVGIELVPEAIESARANATLNKITNVTFIAEAAEKALKGALKTHDKTTDIVVIVDPPRSGLHSSALRAIRSCPQVKSIIYVSCNHKSLGTDLLGLTKPPSKRYQGEPFETVTAIACDMFPHTDHVETLVLMRRQEAEEASAADASDPAAKKVKLEQN